jgi:hypothetical protein
MSRDRGFVLQRALATYLTRWWPHAESVPNGHPGRDILGTPDVWWENKTSFKGTSAQAVVWEVTVRAGGEMPVVVYWPPGVGKDRPERAIAMTSLPAMMDLLVEAGYAPAPDFSEAG